MTENETYRFDALLYATGRKPNVEPLQLENTDIELTERGAIKVDKHCQTNVPGVFAVGDVRLKDLRQVTTAVWRWSYRWSRSL